MNGKNKAKEILIPLGTVIAFVVIWQIVCVLGLVPGFMLPSPLDVGVALVREFPLLMHHAGVTLLEAFLGLVAGVLLGFCCAALMDTFPLVKSALYPILVLTQTIPPVAIAPLLILWFSYGIVPKVILVVLVSFFPMAVGLLEGFQSVDPDMVKLLKSMGADRLQIFWNVKFPSAMGNFFSGLKIAVSYSIVGAVIAEWLGGFTGLGVYMTRVKKSLSYDKMFAVILLVSLISLLLMEAVKYIQYKSMPWDHLDDR
ncbi:MAG: ABC transporter permease [Lachnospiraceae bacterium]|nr:ABC transporter permease [Lachnospiraceae bacterium]